MDIESNIQKLQIQIAQACERSQRLLDEVTLVAVSKGFEATAVKAAFDCGIRDFGENRVQEAEDKIEQLSNLKPDVIWHMVGHLQSNKANMAAKIFNIIHSVDSIKLAVTLNHQTQKALPVLLQVNVSGELTKSGFTAGELDRMVKEIKQLPDLEVKGLMTIAPLTADPEEVRPIFRKLRELRDYLKLEHLSMGMTDDFEVAIEEGATILRIGRAIFGKRRQ